MILLPDGSSPAAEGIPRESGDDPEPVTSFLVAASYSPQERG